MNAYNHNELFHYLTSIIFHTDTYNYNLQKNPIILDDLQ